MKVAQTPPPTPLTTIRPEMVKGKSDSAITKHKIITGLLAKCNVLSHFSVVARVRSKSHLNVSEAIFIAWLKPELCLQKEFVRRLCLFRGLGVMLDVADIFAPLCTVLYALNSCTV